MRLLPALLVFVFASQAAPGAAPLSVRLRTEKDTFLVYEPVPVNVTIQNLSGRPVHLEDDGDKSWLGFLVTDESNSLVRQLAQPDTDEPLVIAPGQAVSRTIDLLPLYELRARGVYRVQATVGQAASTPLRIAVVNGRELWSQVVGLPGSDEYRTYTVLARRGDREDALYISVRDDERQVAYSLLSLGSFLASSRVQALVDRGGALHVLFQNGPRSFGYLAVDGSARILARAAYSDFQSTPRLYAEQDGAVRVRGGEQRFPLPEPLPDDEDDEVVPQPKPKRPWWQFWRRS